MARPRQVTDEQILATMRACALEHGAQVSLDVVAERLSVTSPALLKRFGCRQELMVKALRPPASPPFVERFLEGPDRRPLRVQLAERLREMAQFFDEVVPCVLALRESGVPHERIFEGRHTAPLTAIKAIARWLLQADAAGLATVRAPESVAVALLGAVQTRAVTAHLANVRLSRRSTNQYLDDLVNLFATALARKRRRAPSPRSAV
jgi:hypothetical protein